MPLNNKKKVAPAKTQKVAASSEIAETGEIEEPIASQPCFTKRLDALKGYQGDREYFVVQLKVGELADLLTFAQRNVPAPERIQRDIKPLNVGKIADYIMGNRMSYIFSGVTLLVVGGFDFFPITGTYGELCLHEGAELLPLDGQHRLLGLQKALHKDPDLADEYISAAIYKIDNLMARRQAFHDINSANPVPTGIKRAMNHRSNGTYLVSSVIAQDHDLRISVFAEGCIEHDKSSVTGKSTKIFPYKTLHEAIVASSKNFANSPIEKQIEAARSYWHTVSLAMKDWAASPPQTVRDQTIATHSITVNALGRLGAQMMPTAEPLNDSKIAFLQKLAFIDWSKCNPEWQEFNPATDYVEDQKTESPTQKTEETQSEEDKPEEVKSEAPTEKSEEAKAEDKKKDETPKVKLTRIGVLNSKGKVITSGAAERICDYLIAKLELPTSKPKAK